MKRLSLALLLLFDAAFSFAQPIHLMNDKRYAQHWKSMNDCSLQEINSIHFKGISLDGCLLSQTDKALFSTIESILGSDTTNNLTVECSVDIDEVYALERLLYEVQKSNSNDFPTILLKSGSFFRQYLGVTIFGEKYLFVSFQRDESFKRNKRIRNKNFDLFKLVYSRLFLFKHIDSPASQFDYFWLLYDPKTNTIVSFYRNQE